LQTAYLRKRKIDGPHIRPELNVPVPEGKQANAQQLGGIRKFSSYTAYSASEWRRAPED
jgi:hypothetical protein